MLPNGDKFFIRPCLDNKSFAGMVTTWEDFHDWQTKIKRLDEEDSYSTLTGDE